MIKGGGKVPPDISSVRDTLSTVLPPPHANPAAARPSPGAKILLDYVER
jgi:hypothetical protein